MAKGKTRTVDEQTAKRLHDLAAGWEGSESMVSLSPADCLALGLDEADDKGRPTQVKGADLFDMVARLKQARFADGAESSPNQASLTPDAAPDGSGDETDDGAEGGRRPRRSR